MGVCNKGGGHRYLVEINDAHKFICIVPLKRAALIAVQVCSCEMSLWCIFDSMDDAMTFANEQATTLRYKIVPASHAATEVPQDRP